MPAPPSPILVQSPAQDSLMPTRFIGLDVHKRYVTVAAVDTHKQVVLTPRRVFFDQFESWAARVVTQTDAVVLEATSNAWHIHDLLLPLAVSVTVANPAQVSLIAGARVKTDPRDALTLAKLLAAELIPVVWVPPQEVRDLRGLVGHRRRLVSQRTQARNRLHSLLLQHDLSVPSAPFTKAQRAWWDTLDLSATEQLRIQQDLAFLDALDPLITALDTELLRLSTLAPWADQAAFLVQLPGISIKSAMVILSAVGDIRRFRSAKALVGYAGLGAGIYASGQTHHGRHITKQGRRELRTTMVESAWRAVANHPHWKAVFDRLKPTLGPNKAIVAIARKLLVVCWHVLFEQVSDRYAIPEKVAAKLLVWAERLGKTHRGSTRGAFVQRELQRVKVGAHLSAIPRGRRAIPLPVTPAGPVSQRT